MWQSFLPFEVDFSPPLYTIFNCKYPHGFKSKKKKVSAFEKNTSQMAKKVYTFANCMENWCNEIWYEILFFLPLAWVFSYWPKHQMMPTPNEEYGFENDQLSTMVFFKWTLYLQQESNFY